MPEYIERDKLQEHFENVVSKHEAVINGSTYPVYLCDHTLHEIRNAPAADVTEVVRCKDCEHSHFIASCSKFMCRKGCGELRYSNDFCSFGKRREGAEK